jgi:hypothetical protein
MSTIRQMLPPVAQPFTEVVVGAGLGALIGGYVLGRRASTGALVGALAGYGVALTKAKGMWPLTLTAGVNQWYVGDSVSQQQTNQMGFVQPYQQPAVAADDDDVAVQPEVEVVEEVVPQYMPEHHRRRHEWWHGRERGRVHGRSPYAHYGRHHW